MNLLLKLFRGNIKKALLDYIKKNSFRDNLVKKINENVDLPKLTEEEERVLINMVYESAIDSVIESIDKI